MSYTFLNMRPQVSAFKDSASLDVKVRDHYVLQLQRKQFPEV